jgi:hypothetical protein
MILLLIIKSWCSLFFFKFMIAFRLLASDTSDELDIDGWHAIPKGGIEEQGIGADERDLSVWVVFSKKIGTDKVLISLPAEPTYRYIDQDGNALEVKTQSGGCEYRLLAMNQVIDNPAKFLEQRMQNSSGIIPGWVGSERAEEVSGFNDEITYWKDGFWHHECIVVSREHTYLLQTKSVGYSIEAHHQFSSTFCIENHA